MGILDINNARLDIDIAIDVIDYISASDFSLAGGSPLTCLLRQALVRRDHQVAREGRIEASGREERGLEGSGALLLQRVVGLHLENIKIIISTSKTSKPLKKNKKNTNVFLFSCPAVFECNCDCGVSMVRGRP